MRPETLNAIVAIAGGVVLAVVAFVPAAAVRYRRAGRFTVADLLALFVVPVYGVALWTYTLLPLPDPGDVVCRAAILEPLHFVGDIRSVWTGSPLELLRDAVFLQIVLNVALFVPVGVILRARYRRGVRSALVLGISVSLLIELTQLSGIWGLYECAYRFFDVDDLLFNTVGAVLGSVVAAPFAGRLGHDDEHRPATAPTLGRRVVAILSDLMSMIFIGAVVVIAWRVWQLEVRGVAASSIDPSRQAVIQWGSAFAVQAVTVLATGATIGELVVRVRTRARRPIWTLPARLVKLVSGVGVVASLGAWESSWSTLVLVVAVLVILTAAFTTRDHRGLSNLLAGLEVTVLPPISAADDAAGGGTGGASQHRSP